MTSKDRGLNPVPSNFINICLLFRIVVDEIKENTYFGAKFQILIGNYIWVKVFIFYVGV